MMEFGDLLKAKEFKTGLLHHLDLAGVVNLMATSKSVQQSIDPMFKEALRSFCGVQAGHGIEKHCVEDIVHIEPNWLAAMDAFKDNKGKSMSNALKIPVLNLLKTGKAKRLTKDATGMLQRRVVGFDPTTSTLSEDPGKSDSSAFCTRVAFNAALYWLVKAYISLKTGENKRTSGRFRYKGVTFVVEFDSGRNGYKLVAPISILGEKAADMTVSYCMNYKFAEVAATIYGIYDALGGVKKANAELAAQVIEAVVLQVVKKQPTKEIVAIFKADQVQGDFLFSLYPQ